ncbi:MAG: hypothetical protein JXB13_00925 [Phycisphaerae bacterium]|nr:hypothetical protein [Phycisphaerae bacterium]
MTADLVVLVPDKDIEQAICGLLERYQSLGIRRPSVAAIIVHPNRDPGVFHTGHQLIRPFVGAARFALIVFDRAWEGAPSTDAEALSTQVEGRCRCDWGDHASCVCIDPEVENWVWSDSPHVATALGWPDRSELLCWLRSRGLWPADAAKPPDPKAAFEAAVREKKIVPSSSIFGKLARNVGLDRCHDPAFLRLRSILHSWFPLTPAS